MQEQETQQKFRNYSATANNVRETYKKMHECQTLEFVKTMLKDYGSSGGYIKPNGQKLYKNILDVFAELDSIIDESDPDTHLPQIYHAFQTGEALKVFLNPDDITKLKTNITVKSLFTENEWVRIPGHYQKYFQTHVHSLYAHIKDWSWLPLVGFIHDAGKVLAASDWGALPQWAVVGDTFPIGINFASSNIFFDDKFYVNNLDINIDLQNADHTGIYASNCGFDNVYMSWGHDEYFYSVLKRTSNHLVPEALYMIRFHSFYPWHTPRNGIRGYEALASEYDWKMLPLLKMFQKSDLYSKRAKLPDIEALQSDYFKLFEHFVIPNNTRKTSHTQSKLADIIW